MTTPIVYPIPLASLPGGVDAWIPQSAIHLREVLLSSKVGQVAALFANLELDAVQPNVNVSYNDTLSDADYAAMVAACQHANDYFAVFVDGVLTDVGTADAANFPTISKPAGDNSASSIQLQLKDGAKNNVTVDGVGAVLSLTPEGYMTVTAPSPAFDAAGQYTFTTGVEMSRIGIAQLVIECGTLPLRAVNIAFTGS